MTVSLSTMWWEDRQDPLISLARSVRALGFEQVELNYSVREESFPALREALAQTGLTVSSVHGPFPRPPGEDALLQADLAADDPAARRRAEALIARSLEETAGWGSPVLVLHSGNIELLRPQEARLRRLYRAGQTNGDEFSAFREELRQSRSREAPGYLERVQQALARLAPLARSLGVTLALENRAHFHDIPSFDEIGPLMEEFGPAVGYWHDLGHAFRLEVLGFWPQGAWLERYGDHLVGMHLHDSIGLEDHQPPGEGDIPFQRLAPLLPARVCRVLEVRSCHDEEAVAAGLAHLQATGVLP